MFCLGTLPNWYKTAPIKAKKVLSYTKQDSVKQFVVDYLLKHPCDVCGENNILTLEFHHTDRSFKTFNVSQGVSKNYSLKQIRSEIEACSVLCSNCHKKVTATENKSYKSKAIENNGYIYPYTNTATMIADYAKYLEDEYPLELPGFKLDFI